MSFDDYNASSSGDPNIIKTDHFHVTQFEPDPEIYNLASGMEIFGFPYKNYYSKQSDITNATLIVSQESTTTWNNRVSLSLSEFRQDDDSRFGPSSSRSVNNMQEYFRIRNSKYLEPARELLNEFCEGNRSDEMKKVRKSCSEWEDENFVRKQHFYSLDLLELQKRKSRLLQMLEEVERRYKSYCNQMKSVVSSFELVAGNGAARVYSSMASQAMSRHFRCLKDGILTQIKATKTAMGDKDTAAPGTTKGETPRLRLLDQTLRQQRAFQQMRIMETHPWRPQRGLPEKSVAVLRAWLFEHFLHPYPSDVDKHILARQTGLSRSQVSNWFINARVRLWKPMVEEMYLEDLKEDDGPAAANLRGSNDQQNQNPTHEDKKSTHDQLTRTDSECLSSIKSTLENDPNFGGDKFGPTQFDFSSYNHHSGPAAAAAAAAASYLNENTAHHNYGGVSLTLGLQQHGGSGGGVSQSSVFYTILDSENQNLPYKNLIGSQLLHDLVG